MKTIKDPTYITPVEKIEGCYFKRDDMFAFHKDYPGTKARVCLLQAMGQPGIISTHTISNQQGPLVAATAKKLNIPCRIHTYKEAIEPLMPDYIYTSTVIVHPDEETAVKAALTDSKLTGFKYMAAHMDSTEGNMSINRQCGNIPDRANRVIIPGFTGTTAVSILEGLIEYNKPAQVLVVGFGKIAQIKDHFELFGPFKWQKRVRIIEITTPPESLKAFLKDWGLHPNDLVWLDGTY